MSGLRAVNLAVKFGLELAAVAAFAIWGASTDGTGASILLAVVAPALAVVLWGRFAAPNSRHRLPTSARIPFELIVFGLAALALLAAGHDLAAIIYASTAAINALFLTWLGDWEQ
jgi:hypothetical protein